MFRPYFTLESFRRSLLLRLSELGKIYFNNFTYGGFSAQGGKKSSPYALDIRGNMGLPL